MKINYQNTIDGLKETGLIQSGDKYAVCLFKNEDYGTTVTTSLVDYIIIANDEELKLLPIHQKTGEYLGDFITFKKEDIVYKKKNKEKRFIRAWKGLLGGMYIAIRFMPEKFAHDYVIPKKLCGFEQIKERTELFEFVKQVYNPVYEMQEKQFKGKL
ncbi:MAG: hypothetical protein K2G38_02685 [Clostridia bacterium]|nr:hypothetical protein [Clostridia bacterium]